MTPEAVEHAREYAAGLRALADMVETHPEIDTRYASLIVWHPNTSEELAAIARAALKHGGTVRKEVDDKYDLYTLRVLWGPLEVRALARRGQVCERVVVDTLTVTETVKDPLALAAVPEIEQTVERDIVRWECAPLLAAEKEALHS